MTDLNNFLPLQQWRQVLGETSLTPHGRRIKRELKFSRSRIQPRPHLIRDGDSKQGDLILVLISCSKCPVETRIVYEDRNPRYEISTRKYILYYKQCQLCGRALITAINRELPSIRAQYVPRETDVANRNLVAQELIRREKAGRSERRYASRPTNSDAEAAWAWNRYEVAEAAVAADTQSSTTKARSKAVQLQFERRQVQKIKVSEGDALAPKARDNHNADCRKRQTRHREPKKYNQKPKMKSPLIGATEGRIMREEARVRLENLQWMEMVQGGGKMATFDN
jgi:hypothetical protein